MKTISTLSKPRPRILCFQALLNGRDLEFSKAFCFPKLILGSRFLCLMLNDLSASNFVHPLEVLNLTLPTDAILKDGPKEKIYDPEAENGDWNSPHATAENPQGDFVSPVIAIGQETDTPWDCKDPSGIQVKHHGVFHKDIFDGQKRLRFANAINTHGEATSFVVGGSARGSYLRAGHYLVRIAIGSERHPTRRQPKIALRGASSKTVGAA